MSDNEASHAVPEPEAEDEPRAPGHQEKLVVGVDGSAGSTAALQWALAEARLRGADVHLIMAWQHPESYRGSTVWTMLMDRSGATRQMMADAAKAEIDRLGKATARGQTATITWEAVEGHPAEVLVRATEGSSALVVGSRGHGGFVGALLGSVSQHVVAHARCPVVLIPGPAAAAPRSAQRIVVGVDGSAGSLAALAWAVEEGHLRGAPVHAVIAWERATGPGATAGWAVGMGGPPDETDPVMATARAEVARLAAEAARGSDVKISSEAIEGHPARVLMLCAEDAAALVVGSRGHGGFVGALLGSVSQHVVAQARCPVVLIPESEHRGHRHTAGAPTVAAEDSRKLIKLGDAGETVAVGDEDVRGLSVQDKNGRDIGKVDDLLIDIHENKVRFLEVASGGFLGLGRTKSSIPIEAITEITAGVVHINHTREHVARAPDYDPDLVEDNSYYENLYAHYGYMPDWGVGYTHPGYPYYRRE